MTIVRVTAGDGSWRLDGDWDGVPAVNAMLAHLEARAFSPATVRAYAYDCLNFGRFCVERALSLQGVSAAEVFDWIDWQAGTSRRRSGNVVAFSRTGAAPATVNRRVAAVRALFAHQVTLGAIGASPVPAPRRGQGVRPKARGMLGHLGPGRPRQGGRLVRQPRRLPESLTGEEVGAFLADLGSHRDRAIVLVMLLGGLRAGEVRRLRLADVDQGRRMLRVIGKGGRERTVPSTGRSSSNWPPTCGPSGPPRWPRRSASWCCTVPPPGSR